MQTDERERPTYVVDVCTVCGREVRPGVNYHYMHWLVCPFMSLETQIKEWPR